MLVPCKMIAEAPDPTAVRLGADSAMDISGGTVILDRSETGRHATDPASTYLVVVAGVGLLRYVRMGRRSVYLATKADLNRPAEWQVIAEPRCPDLVRGRVYRPTGLAGGCDSAIRLEQLPGVAVPTEPLHLRVSALDAAEPHALIEQGFSHAPRNLKHTLRIDHDGRIADHLGERAHVRRYHRNP